MARKKIGLIKVGQILPFVETAKRLGAPVRELALASALPLEAVLAGEGVIGELSAWRFIHLAAESIGNDHLGYLTALDHPVTSTRQLGGWEIQMASTLRKILQIFIRQVVNQSDRSNYRLVRRHEGLWFTREVPFGKHDANWLTEQYVLAFVIQIVRLCAPVNWLPRRMRIASMEFPVNLPAEWHAIKVEWGSPRTELLIGRDVLELTPQHQAGDARSSMRQENIERDKILFQDLVDRQIWSSRIGLDLAAHELDMSSATLKRRLNDINTNYSEILRQRRLHHATRLLDETDMSVATIAHALSYSLVSNFSRSFRNDTGISPTTRRKNSKPAR